MDSGWAGPAAKKTRYGVVLGAEHGAGKQAHARQGN